MKQDVETFEWYAISTKFRCEKYVVDVLRRKGIEAYVPLLKRTRRYVRKIVQSEIPLINCYAFVRITPRQRVAVLEVPYVHHFIGFEGKIVPVPEEEMQMMRRVVGELSEVTVEPRAWVEGDKVEVIAGNLTGIQGTLLARNGKHEFVIELETLGYQLRMVVDRSVLRRVTRIEHLAAS